MRLAIISKDTITLDSLMKMRNELYYISMSDDMDIAAMEPLTDVISNASVSNLFDKDDYTIVRITKTKSPSEIWSSLEPPKLIPKEPEKEIEPQVDIVRDKPFKTWERQTYKINCTKKDGSIMIEGRPKGEIRVSFNDKEDAQAWFERIREIFYTNNSHADAISVDNLYAELGFTKDDLPSDYSKEEGDKWGYLTIEHGPVKYVSDVSKTKNSKLWGFTIKRPIKIYGMTETKWWEKHKKLQEEEYGESVNSARMDGGLS